ncbi:MAG: RHS repeat-associated core domain-containing protein [Candidatus Komeilibacteria bacterium]|nr:RHS repeat-associated core domain-containing protein [Candidatus Komeilibacteria bacterium]
MKKTIILALLALFIITPFSQVLAVGTDYRYTSKPYDANTNLYYYGQRYYDPMSGRFTQPDPVSNNLANPQKLKQSTGQDLQQFLQNPQAFNEYSYTQNNPIKYIDPEGESIRQVIRGEQSLPEYQIEIGEGAEVLYNQGGAWKAAMDYPVVTGATVGIGGGLLAKGLVVGVGVLRGFAALAGFLGGSNFNVSKEFSKLSKIARGAYDIAKSGGTNYKMIENAKKLKMTVEQVQQSINSLEQKAIEHLYRIKDPSTYSNYQEFASKTVEQQKIYLGNWHKQAENFLKQAEVWKGYLNELTK